MIFRACLIAVSYAWGEVVMPSRQKMTGWYDPVRLVAIGIRVAEATVFGKMFDRRELVAALDPFDKSDFDANFDFSLPSHLGPDGNFWLDSCGRPPARTIAARARAKSARRAVERTAVTRSCARFRRR